MRLMGQKSVSFTQRSPFLGQRAGAARGESYQEDDETRLDGGQRHHHSGLSVLDIS